MSEEIGRGVGQRKHLSPGNYPSCTMSGMEDRAHDVVSGRPADKAHSSCCVNSINKSGAEWKDGEVELSAPPSTSLTDRMTDAVILKLPNPFLTAQEEEARQPRPHRASLLVFNTSLSEPRSAPRLKKPFFEWLVQNKGHSDWSKVKTKVRSDWVMD